MTRAEFKTQVLTYLDVDATRRGIEPLRNAVFNAACRDLNFYVPAYATAKSTYADGDTVPYSLEAAEAVAEYIKERLVRQLDRDVALAREHGANYRTLRRRLYLVDHALTLLLVDSATGEAIDDPTMSFTIKRNDTLPYLQAQLLDAAVAADISGATAVEFILRATCSGKALFVKPAVVLNAATGSVRYEWAVGDTATAGAYRGEFQVTYGTQKSTYPSNSHIPITIIADLG